MNKSSRSSMYRVQISASFFISYVTLDKFLTALSLGFLCPMEISLCQTSWGRGGIKW